MCVCACVCVCGNGVYLRLPYTSCRPQCVTLLISPVRILLYVCPHTLIYLSSYRDYSEMVLEFGALRRDNGMHRLVEAMQGE